MTITFHGYGDGGKVGLWDASQRYWLHVLGGPSTEQ